MTPAYAAEGAAQGHGAFYADPAFWVAVAFILLLVLAGKKIYLIACEGLDKRAEGIKEQIDEAQRLREEAQELLASYERKQRDAATEAEGIVQHAREEAERLSAKAVDDLERSLKRREAQAMDRIAQAEVQAAREVRIQAVEIATQATEQLLAEKATGAKADQLIDNAIKELPSKLH